MCKVSVIVPNYNHSRYLYQRLDSILAQSYKDLEILILDDCSTDNSQNVILHYAYKHPYIKVLFNNKNSGNTFVQWEKGIENTSGDYIWIAESDDVADPKFLETLVPVLDKNPNVGVVYSQSWDIDEKGKIIGSYLKWTNDLDALRWEKHFINNGIDELKNFFSIKNTIPNASAAIFRRTTVQKIGPLEKSMRLVGDKMFWTNILLYSDIAYVPAHLNFFRTHSNNVRTKSSSRVNLIENFRWLTFLRQQIVIPDFALTKIYDRYYKWWVSLFVGRPISFFSRDNKEVLRAAKEADRLSFLRLIKYILSYYYCRLEARVFKKKSYA